MTALAYYVSGHGFGHAVRSAEVIRALAVRNPDLDVHLRTVAPRWLFPSVASYEPVALDTGVVQPDALRIDQAASLRLMAQLADRSPELVAKERSFLREVGAQLVVADIPPLAILAARSAGIPSVVLANFFWDWIYEAYIENEPGFRWLIEWLHSAYAQADRVLRLPFHSDRSVFGPIDDVPLITPLPSSERSILRRRFGLRAGERAVLLAFGGLGLARLRLERLGELGQYRFFGSERELPAGRSLPPNVERTTVRPEEYVDLMASCDAVVTKPGYGVVSSCIALRLPLLYTDRGSFPEYSVLVDAVHAHGRGVYIPHEDLLAGNLGPYLDQLLSLRTPWSTLPTNGAEIVADRLQTLLLAP